MLSHSFTLLVILVIDCSKERGGEYLRKEFFLVIAFSFILEAEFLFLESCASYLYIYVDITISRNTGPVYLFIF